MLIPIKSADITEVAELMSSHIIEHHQIARAGIIIPLAEITILILEELATLAHIAHTSDHIHIEDGNLYLNSFFGYHFEG